LTRTAPFDRTLGQKSAAMAGDRFNPGGSAQTMKAIVTIANGGYDKLVYRDVAVPVLAPGEVLVQVLAACVNNTEINIRIGWYVQSVTGGTAAAAIVEDEQAIAKPDGGWNAATPFTLIQGTDCCGRIVAVGSGGDARRIGSRVLVRACMRVAGFAALETSWMGSDFDGAFAQSVELPGEPVAMALRPISASDRADAERP
jgi:NADPH:quinone reductase-like Zn-dependent oxidoreductase